MTAVESPLARLAAEGADVVMLDGRLSVLPAGRASPETVVLIRQHAETLRGLMVSPVDLVIPELHGAGIAAGALTLCERCTQFSPVRNLLADGWCQTQGPVFGRCPDICREYTERKETFS